MLGDLPDKLLCSENNQFYVRLAGGCWMLTAALMTPWPLSLRRLEECGNGIMCYVFLLLFYFFYFQNTANTHLGWFYIHCIHAPILLLHFLVG